MAEVQGAQVQAQEQAGNSGANGNDQANGTSAASALTQLTETIAKSVLGTINEKLRVNNQQILEEVNGLLSENSSEIAERAAKRLRSECPELTNPGNIDQFRHNNEVMHSIERAANAVIKGDGEASIRALNEGKKLISNRQKLVRLADREEKGWRFVREYVKDNIADDSDDEKQIRRARKTTNDKFPTRGRGRGSNRGRGYFRRGSNFRNNSYNYNRDHQGNSGYRGGNQGRNDFRRDRFDRECFVCRKRGHLSFNCPDRNERS